MFITIPLFSQLNFNLNIGLNLCKIHDDLVPFEYNFSPRFNWKGGIQIEYIINYKQSIETGIYLTARSSNVDPNLFQTTSIVTYYLYENTILYRRYFYNNKLGLGIGVCNTWPQSYGIHLFGDRSYYLDLIIGCKYKINDRFNIDMSFLFGDIMTVINKDELFYFSVYNLSVSVKLGNFFQKNYNIN